MGEISQPKDKIGSVGFGLSSKEQITPADAVLAEESANEVRLVLMIRFSFPSNADTVCSFCRFWILRSCPWGSSPLKTFSKARVQRDLVSPVC